MKYFLPGIILTVAFSGSALTAYGQSPRAIPVSFEYLEACEMGPVCNPIVVSRKRGEQVELALPDLSRTVITVWDKENLGKLAKRQGTYEPIYTVKSIDDAKPHGIILPLSELKDGTYHFWVTGDSVGGFFRVHLKTE